jgi:autotransporter-associated beta strand protein
LFYGASPEATRPERLVRRLRIALLASSALCAAALPAAAQDATWLLAPGSGDFNTAANWSPPPVPTGTAHFAASGTTALSLSANTTMGSWTFNAGSPAYTFLTNGHTLEFTRFGINGAPTITIVGGLQFSNNSSADGATIINNSGTGLLFIEGSTAASASITNNSHVNFQDVSSASNATIANNVGGFVGFFQTTTAATANITNSGQVQFSNGSTASSATIANNSGALLQFRDTSSAAGATITNSGGTLNFGEASTASNATIANNVGGVIGFFQTSTAATATITNSGNVQFSNSSTAATATIINSGNVRFSNTSTAGNAAITNGASGVTDFSLSSGANNDHKLSAGSINGAGLFNLGQNELTVGGNNLSTNVTGVIADGGAGGGSGAKLIKTGTGNMILSGNNTYSGGTTISAGTLQIGDGGATGSVLGNITNNAALIFNRSDAVSFGNVIGGSGTLTKLGAGTLALTAANTYSGGTVLDAGTIRLGNNAALGTGGLVISLGSILQAGSAGLTVNNAITVAGGGATIDTNGNTMTLAGVISGNGANSLNGVAINKIGTGTLVLAGNNTFAHDVNIDAGTVSVASAANLGNGRVRISNSSTFAVTANATIANEFFINGATGVFDIAAGTTTRIQGAISDIIENPGFFLGGVTKTGAGIIELSGNNTYIGGTFVKAGILRAGSAGAFGPVGPFKNVNVSSGATVDLNGFDQTFGALGGSGTVTGANSTISGALVAGEDFTPGQSLKIVGNLALQSGALYLAFVTPASSSFTSVTGTAVIGGATALAFFDAGAYVQKKYTILTATGGVSGTFAAITTLNAPSNFHSALSYDPNNVYLDLILDFAIPGGLNANQQNVGDALTNFFNRTGGIPAVFANMSANGLSQAAGETGTGSQQSTFNAMNQFMSVMMDPFLAGRGEGATAGGGATGFADEEALAYAAKKRNPNDALAAIYTKASPIAPFQQRWSVWAAGYGGSQTTDGNAAGGSSSTTSRIYGTAIGADYRFSPFTIAGFSLAGGGTSFSVANNGTGRSDLFQAGAFIRHNIGAAYLSGALAYGWQDVTTDRTVTIAGIDQLRAKFSANAWSGRVEGGYRFVAPVAGGIGLTPYAAGQFTTFELPAYAEGVISGANTFALAYGAKSLTDTRSELGLRTDKSFAMQSAILTLRGRLAWAHDFNPDRGIGATFQALPGASFFVNGAAQAADSALVTASAETKWMNGWSTAATFEGEFSSVTRSYAGKGVARYAW